MSSAGGVGVYVKQNLSYMIRTELSTSNSDFESLWIEIDNKSHKNFICGIIYRRPNSNSNILFMEYLNSTIEKVHREKKLCSILGNSHQITDDFYFSFTTSHPPANQNN